MADFTTVQLDPGCPPPALWAAVAQATAQACSAQGVVLRDAVLLVPFAQLIEPARRAFSAGGGWQPRVETTDTWAASLGPPPLPQTGQLSGQTALDELTAAQMLRQQAGLRDWERRDARGFAEAVLSTVDTAQTLHRAAHQRAPATRDEFWSAALAACAAVPQGQPGALEASLARLAAEWARWSPPAATDRLFDARPGALIWVDAGGADPLPAALAAALQVPAVRLDADPPSDRPFDATAAYPAPRVTVVDGMEAEARAVAGEVIDALARGLQPVALVALDRALTRRARALLERRGVVVADETGWALSTTRAAASVMALLVAARSDAGRDEWLATLKTWSTSQVAAAVLQQLERLWRADKPIEGEPAGRLVAWARETTYALGQPGRQALQGWLDALGQALRDTGLGDSLAADPAGRQVLAALRLGLNPASNTTDALTAAMQAESLDVSGFHAWVDRTLERSTYVVPNPPRPDVVVTPLARAMLRPFGATVVGAADELNLLAAPRVQGLLPEAVAGTLGLPTSQSLWVRERLALAQVLRHPELGFVRRKLDGPEPLAASTALESMALARRRLGQPALGQAQACERRVGVALQPVHRPTPTAADDLPAQMSASTLEALRACPYKFFARSVLRLKEVDELAEAVGKRDYGNWLHAVLDRFHRHRGDAGADDVALRRAADEESNTGRIESARLLPFRIAFDALSPKYLAWLHARESAGQRWRAGEFDADRSPPELAGMRLHGRIDREDAGPAGTVVIDYKTGSVAKLQSQLREPCEDTQLAFYALLMQADLAGDGHVRAMYLALDTPGAPKELEHKNVARTARILLGGLASDLQRLRSGAGLPALGEGKACEICDARGLCRRDHWSTPA